MTCLACGDNLIPKRRWGALSREERADMMANGTRRPGACGMCERCYLRAYRGSTRRQHRHDYVLSEWEMFVNHNMSRWRNCELIAPRLDMTPAALERALDRAGVRGWGRVA